MRAGVVSRVEVLANEDIVIEIEFRGHCATAGIPVIDAGQLSDQQLFDRLRSEVNRALDFYEELHVRIPGTEDR